jgi:uncharacterized membrane protein
MMDRAQFMQELEKLLADISETERQDALDFYNSYFDDAGAENEASVLRELGSPEKVAAIIKADLKGSAGGYEYGEYTEHGYEDARTKERGQMPERYEEESGTGKRFFRKGNQAVLILAVILLVFISPFVKGAVGGILTFAVGILLLPFWLIVGLGIGAVVLLVGGCGWSRAFGCNDRNRDPDHRNWMSDDCSGNPYDIRTDQHCSTHCAEMVSEDY